MQNVVYVLDNVGNPLMPTKRFGRVGFFLQEGLAKITNAHPFTIQLIYEIEERKFGRLQGAIRLGRTDIGVAVVTKRGEVVYEAHVTSRNREIPKLLGERAEHRHASRQGARQRRKRRARKNGTTTEFPEGRTFFGYDDGMSTVKDIRSKEAKIDNRKEVVLGPVLRQCAQTHLSIARLVRKLLPVTDWTIVCDDLQKMGDGCIPSEVRKFKKHGHLKRTKQQIFEQQDGCCALCGNPITCFHHILPKRKGGSDRKENLVGLCQECHVKIHTNRATIDCVGVKKKESDAAVIREALPYIYDAFRREFGEDHVTICSSSEVKAFREAHGMDETCEMDAVCAAAVTHGVDHIVFEDEDTKPFEIRQFRNHNRARIHAQSERTYRLDGKTVAKNRKPRYGQQGPALSDWFKEVERTEGREAALKKLARLTVMKSQRRYNDLNRPLPGTVFRYKGKVYVMQGQRTNGKYLIPVGHPDRNIPRRDCEILGFRSLVYLQP